MPELRDSFFNNLIAKARANRNVILLTADMGAYALRTFQRDLPNQFFNVGIAEQNMVSVAAGLALEGKEVYVYTIAPFLILRALEQIKIDVCNMDTNVTLIGVGAGLEYSYDGSTHHCTNDIGILRTMPNLQTYAPFDEETIVETLGNHAPKYIRLPKGNYEELPKTKMISDLYMVRGSKNGQYIVTYGVMTHHIMRMLTELKTKNVGLIAFNRLSPLPDLKRYCRNFIVVEQHSRSGSLYEALQLDHRQWFGYDDTFVDVAGSLHSVEVHAGMNYNELYKTILEMDYAI